MSDPGHPENAPRSIVGVVFRFGPYELDPVRETLHGPDGPLPLRDHALRVLKLLIERAPEVVSRDDILDEVWGHQALSESSIAQVIRDIRAVLVDSARSPRFVATRYGRGYQFVGDVVRIEPGIESGAEPTGADGVPSRFRARPSTRSPQDAPTRPISGHARSRRKWRPLLLATIAMVAIGLWHWAGDESSLPSADAGETLALRAISPDGGVALSSAFVDYLAFVLAGDLGSDRVDVVRDGDEVDPASRVIEVSLSSLESGDRRELELSIGRTGAGGPEFRQRFDEASELVQRGLDEILASVEHQADGGIRLESGLVSRSGFAVETLLRGMAAQFAGDVKRAAELFEAALAEDPGFEFARYELAIAVRRSGDHERALAILEPMADRLESDFWRFRIDNARGIAYWQLDRFDQALDALRRAEALADSPAGRAIVLGNIALLERNQGALDQAEATGLEAVRNAVLTDSPRLQAGARNTLASIQLRLDRVEDALVQLDLARESYYEAGDLAGYSAVLSRTARIRAGRGERAEAESLLRLALGIREQIGDEDGVADIQIRLARIHRIEGDFEQARVLARNGLDRAQSLQEDDLVIDGYQALAALALAERRNDQARSYGMEALRLAEQTGRGNDQRAVRHGLLMLGLESGATTRDDLLTQTNALVDEADAADDRLVAVRARILAARIHRELERADDARRVLIRAEELANADRRLQHELDAERVRLALSLDDYETASRRLEALERTQAPDRIRLVLRAQLQEATGDLTAAIETAGLARATIGDWWTAEHQADLDAWTAALRD